MKKLFLVPVLSFGLLLTSCDKVVSLETPVVLTNNSFNVDSGIVAKFLFNNNSIDSTIYRNDGIITNARFVTDRFGRSNQSYYSNNGLMESNNIPFNISRNYSITFWVKMIKFTEGNALLELNKGDDEFTPQVWMHKNYIYLAQCNKSQNRIMIGYVPYMLNRWVNVTWTLCNGLTVMYVDGQRVGVSNFQYPNYSDITLTVGNASNHGDPCYTQPSNACVDDVIIYNRVLSEKEITYISKN